MSTWENPTADEVRFILYDDLCQPVRYTAPSLDVVIVPDECDYAVPSLAPQLVKAQPKPVATPKAEAKKK